MRKLLLLVMVWLLAASALYAQTPAAPNGAAGANAPATATPKAPAIATPAGPAGSPGNSIQGCLGGSVGNYVLTQASTGNTYTLIGATQSLQAHVGHEIQVNGGPSSGNGATNPSTTTSSAANPVGSSNDGTANNTYSVTSVVMIADHCGPQASAGPRPGAASEGAPPAGPITAEQARTDAAGNTRSMGSEGGGAGAQEQAPPSEQASAAAEAKPPARDSSGGATLPKTASNLPILGVLGLGMLLAGLVAGKKERKSRR